VCIAFGATPRCLEFERLVMPGSRGCALGVPAVDFDEHERLARPEQAVAQLEAVKLALRERIGMHAIRPEPPRAIHEGEGARTPLVRKQDLARVLWRQVTPASALSALLLAERSGCRGRVGRWLMRARPRTVSYDVPRSESWKRGSVVSTAWVEAVGWKVE